MSAFIRFNPVSEDSRGVVREYLSFVRYRSFNEVRDPLSEYLTRHYPGVETVSKLIDFSLIASDFHKLALIPMVFEDFVTEIDPELAFPTVLTCEYGVLASFY